MKIQTLITALVLAASGAAFAQSNAATPQVVPVTQAVKDPSATPGLDQRQANQQKRIEQGVASGQLTKRETIRLEKREGKLEADKLMAKSDGKVTPQERHKLQREANRDSRAIYKQKHDRQVAAPAK